MLGPGVPGAQDYQSRGEQALNSGLTLFSCARAALTQLTGATLPQGRSVQELKTLEQSVVELCWGQYLDQVLGGSPCTPLATRTGGSRP